MSSPIWTPAALSSETRVLEGECWRLVEAQHHVSTLKLVDTLEEQALLEDLIEESKPRIPPECRHLDYLLATPFRYGAPYPTGSRFRWAGYTPGVFYASEVAETAVAETAFYRLLFYAESPGTPWPATLGEFTAFSAAYATSRAIDLTGGALAEQRAAWTHPTEYEACQALAEAARAAMIEVIRYQSVRDPEARANLAILACSAFAAPAPLERRTWRMRLGRSGVQAICEYPRAEIEFDRRCFAADPRIASLEWER
ncbi:RES family NAD+ phosphorylase [Microbaculum marinum]|uniref:RES family NAD+ phosphorylase n=1 Tax=Microbaculum marinum TaxID=1764581 RepID=A0AAW9RJK4_9HYPH